MTIGAAYGGEPFKITGFNPAGEYVLIAWTRLPEALALEMVKAKTTGFTDFRYRPVRNRRTGDA